MKNKILLSFGLLLSFLLSSNAQNFEYTPLRASGNMPDDFAKTKTDLFLDEQEQISKNQKRSDYEQERNFTLSSVFSIGKLMKSGSVMYNDELTSYVNEVADKILEDNADLRKRLRFYTLRSPEINAFSTQQGIFLLLQASFLSLKMRRNWLLFWHMKFHISSGVTTSNRSNKAEKFLGAI